MRFIQGDLVHNMKEMRSFHVVGIKIFNFDRLSFCVAMVQL